MATTVFLVFSHQLFKTLFTVPKTIPLCFIEDEFSFRHVPFHAHTLVLRRASMQSVRERLLVKGFQVQYFDTIQHQKLDTVFAELAKKGTRDVQCYELIDHRLEAEVKILCDKHGLHLVTMPTPGFLLDTTWLKTYRSKHRKSIFADFYSAARQKLKILVEDNQPVGGSWMLKAQSASSLPAALPEIHIPEHNRYIEEAIAYVKHHFPQSEGNPEHAVFPVTYADAEDWLENFIHHRLAYFAEHFELSSEHEGMLYHSGISPLMNVGLLMPQQVVEAVLVYHRVHPLPLPSLELFLRLVIGKREWSRFYYSLECKDVLKPKALKRSKEVFAPLPAALLKRVKSLGYCHHVERILLLETLKKAGTTLEEQYYWFSSMFLDAADWALLPHLVASDPESF